MMARNVSLLICTGSIYPFGSAKQITVGKLINYPITKTYTITFEQIHFHNQWGPYLCQHLCI